MSDKTGIQWTDATWNPIRGCSRVSEGCKNCYAERVAARFSGTRAPYAGTITDGRWNGQIRIVPEALDQPLRWKRPRRIFVNSMSDLFHPNVPGDFLVRILNVMGNAKRHTFQVLTKRPDRMREIMGHYYAIIEKIPGAVIPYPNIWLGVSVENQRTAEERIPVLLQTPAAVRFLSCEPLLGPVDLRFAAFNGAEEVINLGGLGWVIVGGESGPGARPCRITWIERIIEDCRAGDVPVFVKQLGAQPYWAEADAEPKEHARGKCDDPAEWPKSLRLREFPRTMPLTSTT